MSKKAAVIMGSDSDLPVMQEAIDKLKHFGIPVEVRIISAHRTPAAAEQFATHAAENGFGVIIAGAGKAAAGWTACCPSCRCPPASRWPPWASTALPMPVFSPLKCWPSAMRS